MDVPEPKEKKKRPSRAKKEDGKKILPQVKAVLETGFNMVGSRNPIWKVSEEEIDGLAKPLANIITDLSGSEYLEKYSDYLALTVASIGIIVPRLMVQAEVKKQKKQRQGGGVNETRSQRPPGAGSGKSDGERTAPANGQNNIKQLIPALAD